LFERIFQKILPARHLDLEEYLTGSPENGPPVLEKSLPRKLPAQDSKIYIYYYIIILLYLYLYLKVETVINLLNIVVNQYLIDAPFSKINVVI